MKTHNKNETKNFEVTLRPFKEYQERQNRKSFMRRKEDFAARLFAYTLMGVLVWALWVIAVSVGG